MAEEELIDRQLLECTSGRSNKFYDVTLVKVGRKYILRARWGKRQGDWRDRDQWKHSGGQYQDKGEHSSLPAANRDFNDLVRSKKRKGYQETDYPKPKKEKKPAKPKEKTLEEASLERFGMLEF